MNFKQFGRTAQLFDYITMSSGVTGYYLKSDGSMQNEGSWNITDYIPCDGLEFTLNAVGGNSPSICLYDENKTFIKGQAYNTGGAAVKASVTITSTTQAKYIRFSYMKETYPDDLSAIMLNAGSTALPYQPYKDWTNTPHYIMGTDTDTLTTLPADLYPNDTTATVGLKGNMVQSSTPSTTTPIQPSECGDLTGNRIDADIYYGTYKQSDGTYQTTRANFYNVQIKPFTADDIGKMFTFVADISPITGNARLCANINGTIVSGSNTEKSVVTFTVETADDLIFFNYGSGSTTVTTLSDIMLVEGSTVPTSHIPYGYKIPISSANTTTPVYLGEVETTRKIKKLVLTGEENWSISGSGDAARFYINIADAVGSSSLYCTHFTNGIQTTIGNCEITASKNLVFNNSEIATTTANWKTWLQQQYANGTPVTIWYVLAEPTTGIVNEPIRKIGDYADEVSGISIPTTAGANTLSVDTTLQPSEVSVNYKGWHPVADVHERENGQWE